MLFTQSTLQLIHCTSRVGYRLSADTLHPDRLHYTCNSVKDIGKHLVCCLAGHDVKEFPANFVSAHVV